MFEIQSATEALTLTSRFAAFGVALTSLELLVQSGPAFARAILTSPPGSIAFTRSKAFFQAMVMLRLVGALAMLAGGTLIPAVFVLAASVWLFLRNSPGQTGAEGMFVLVFGGLVAGWSGDSALRQEAALWFIALQLCLCYFTTGWHKFKNAEWRSGEAILHTFNLRTFGDPRIGGLMVRFPILALLTGWIVIGWECLFPLALVHPAAAVAACGLGVMFHAGTGGIMKLTNFLWAFPAGYPAVLYCAGAISLA